MAQTATVSRPPNPFTLPREKYHLLRNIHTKDFHLQYLVQVTYPWQPYNISIYKAQKAEGVAFEYP